MWQIGVRTGFPQILFKRHREHCQGTFSVTVGHCLEKKSPKRISFKTDSTLEFVLLVEVHG